MAKLNSGTRIYGNVTVDTFATVTGNVTGGNILTGGLISVTGNITGGNVIATGLTGTLATAAQTNITSVGTLGSISVTANVQSGNLRTVGLISATGGITGAAISGTSLTVTTGNVTAGNIINSNANAVGNIGSSTGYFNTVFAKATSAQYADLAEVYVADNFYTPGTVVEFGGNYEITITTTTHSTQVAGIISTQPAYLMNSTQAGEHSLELALVGRVPCSVVGTIRKGDRLVSSNTPGVAQALDINQYQPGCIVGKALAEYNSAEPGVIEVAVGRS